jgi:transcriptional regulator with XRE-family HTH domain
MAVEKDNWLKNLAQNTRRIRKELGLSQQALAEKSRLSMATVAKIETQAVENPTLDTLEALGSALNLSDSLRLLKYNLD